ncbi:GrpB protein [Stigmatella erecta]|uniref:GrpB protein n=1 Tax=Stigmatella erecta TaxID=83460 RepID=A0A1I0CUP8_9BACT|nr:GrpB protein [Stigmatella erecta]
MNLHVFSAGARDIPLMLRMRDWLRANDADRALYAATKALAARTWKYVQHYADAKTAVISGILARAEAAAPSTGGGATRAGR